MASGSLYTKFGGEVSDPSKGFQEGIAAQKTNLKDVIGGIKDLMTLQQDQYVQNNTINLQQYLKDKMQADDLSGLNTPIDQEAIKAKYGNMINLAAVGSTIKEQSDLIKNNAFNKKAAEADIIFQKTGDIIKAREHIVSGLTSMGANPDFADSSALIYDARKAAEIKNAGIRDAQTLETTIANALEIGKTGYNNIKPFVDAASEDVPIYKRAEFKRAAMARIDKYAEASDYNKARITNMLNTHDEETKQIAKAMADNLQQKNDQKLTVSSSSSSGSEGSVRTNRNSHKSDTINLIDPKTGKINPSLANSLGDHVNNFVEKFSSTSDSAMIKALHKDIADNVSDEETAADILGQSYVYAYKGDKWHGNDLSANDLKEMRKRAEILIQQYNATNSGNGNSTSHSSSTSRSGNISFTNSDGLTKFISERQREKQDLANNLMEAARSDKLGGAQGDAVGEVFNKYMKRNTKPVSSAPTTTSIMNLQNAIKTPAITIKNKSQPVIYDVSAKNNTESADDRFARYLKKIEEQSKNKSTAIPAPNNAKVAISADAAAIPKSNTEQPKKSISPLVNMLRWIGSGGIQKKVDEKYGMKNK